MYATEALQKNEENSRKALMTTHLCNSGKDRGIAGGKTSRPETSQMGQRNSEGLCY